MFQLLRDPKFDFMSRGKMMLALSAVIVVASIGVLSVRGLNRGIEFTGGAELQVKYVERPELSTVRAQLAAAGLPNHVVTTIGAADENEISVRIALADGDDRDVTPQIAAALRGEAGQGDRIDVNTADATTLATSIEGGTSLSAADALAVGKAIVAARREVAIFSGPDALGGVPGVSAEVLGHLRAGATFGPLAIRSQSFIGPAIGRELMNKAMLAIIGSLIGMLLYIWVRFQLQWGFAAVVALAHDTIIVLGLFSLFGQELSLPVIAAFLTLVGYSVNDTVVVFDRIRENVASAGSADFNETINRSINQTLSRTVITSGLTWIVVFGLYLFGGSALQPFSFVLTAGVIVGTYSSIFIASPLLVIWRRFTQRRAAAAAGAPATARKVRPGSSQA